MITEKELKTGQSDRVSMDTDLLWCIEALFNLNARGVMADDSMDELARELLKVCKRRLANLVSPEQGEEAIAKLNRLMSDTLRQKTDHDLEHHSKSELWRLGYEEAWNAALNFLSTLYLPSNEARGEGLEEAALWHEKRAERHRRHTGGHANALRHEHYAAEIRLLKDLPPEKQKTGTDPN